MQVVNVEFIVQERAEESELNARQQYSATGDGLGVAECLEVLGLTAMDCHNHEDAKQMFLDAITMSEQLGAKYLPLRPSRGVKVNSTRFRI